jgi:hypothetical protein
VSFLRPEAVAWLRRAGEPALAAGLALWLGWTGLTRLLAGDPVGAVLAALALAAAGWAVASGMSLALWLRRRGGGPGVVEVREGGIAYFGPEGGGVAAIDLLERVELADGLWRLVHGEGVLEIPDGAEGVEAMVATLGSLPGFDTLAVMQARGARGGRMVWHRPRGSGRVAGSRAGPAPAPPPTLPRVGGGPGRDGG